MEVKHLLNTVLKKKKFNTLDIHAHPRWQLDEDAKFLKGAGVKL